MSNLSKTVFVLVLASLVFAGVSIFRVREQASGPPSYQAVFLDNGQVYFGKVQNKDAAYVRLTDVYYLQGNEALSLRKKDEISDLTNVTLIKLGEELHEPKDNVEISRNHVVYIEELTEDSRIVKAIAEYKSRTSN